MGQCLKCGNQVTEKAAFCDRCIEVMDQYPVKPGTVIHLQPRPQRPERKNPESFKETVDKQLLVRAKRSNRWLVALTVIMAALLVATTLMLVESLEEIPEAPAIGRNYSTTKQP